MPLTDIAAQVGTPFYVYSTATLTRHFRLFFRGFGSTDHLVCFAVKALSNVAVLRVLARLGAGDGCCLWWCNPQPREAAGGATERTGRDFPALAQTTRRGNGIWCCRSIASQCGIVEELNVLDQVASRH